MAYIVDPTDASQPSGDKGATQGDDELRALKAYIQTLIGLGSGVNFFRRNAIIGGDFDTNPWQRGINFVGVTDIAFTADRWQYRKSGTVVEDITRVFDGPSVAQAGRLYRNALQMNITTADVAIAAGDFDYLAQVIEGYNWKPLAQVPFVLTFWHKHTKVGTYCVAFRNVGFDRSYVAEYTQALADTWEVATIAVPASPAAGTWDYSNLGGLIVSFARSVGATNQTAPNLWTAGNFFGTANQVNSTDAINNKFTITGVQLEKGVVASIFEQRSIQEELLLCQRYYQKSFAQGVAPAQGVGINTGETDFIAGKAGALAEFAYIPLRPPMRISPTQILTFNPVGASAQVRDKTAGVDCTATATGLNSQDGGFVITATGAAGTAVGNTLGIHWTAYAELQG